MKGEIMKYLLFVLLLVAVIITAGCVGGGQNSVVTPTPQIVYVTVFVTQTPTPITTQLMSGYMGEPQQAVVFSIQGNRGPIVGAEVSATPISSTSSTGISGGDTQSGTTDSGGTVVFAMSSNIKYNIVIKYLGQTKSFSVYPHSTYYLSFFP